VIAKEVSVAVSRFSMLKDMFTFCLLLMFYAICTACSTAQDINYTLLARNALPAQMKGRTPLIKAVIHNDNSIPSSS